MEKVVKKGAPPCGLWLRVGPDLAVEELLRDLQQVFHVINSSDYEKNMHTLEIHGDAGNAVFREKASLLFDFARGKGMACIYRGDPAAAKEMGADGVLVDSAALLAEGKSLFGDDGIAGLACGTSQEMAALAHDEGADFVSFGTGGPAFPPPDVLRFWTILSDKPALIEGPVDNDYAAYWVNAGAAFLDAGDYIWSHGKGVMQGTVNMLYAIDLAAGERESKVQ